MYVVISIIIAILAIASRETSFRVFGAIMLALCIFSFYGFRVNVGVDWQSYKDAYMQNDLGRFEMLFRWYAELLRYFNMPSYFFFGLIGFMQFKLLYSSIYIKNSPWGDVIFVFGYFLLPTFLASANGIRQFAAAAIVIWAFSSLKRYNKYLLYLVSVLFHFSSPLLIVLLELTRRFKINRKGMAVIFIASMVYRISWTQIETFINILEFIPIRRLELVIINLESLNTPGLNVGPRRLILWVLAAILIRFVPANKKEYAMLCTIILLLSVDNLLLDLNSIFRRPLFWWYALLPVTLVNAYKNNDIFSKRSFILIILALCISYWAVMVMAEWHNLDSTDLYLKI